MAPRGIQNPVKTTLPSTRHPLHLRSNRFPRIASELTCVFLLPRTRRRGEVGEIPTALGVGATLELPQRWSGVDVSRTRRSKGK